MRSSTAACACSKTPSVRSRKRSAGWKKRCWICKHASNASSHLRTDYNVRLLHSALARGAGAMSDLSRATAGEDVRVDYSSIEKSLAELWRAENTDPEHAVTRAA